MREHHRPGGPGRSSRPAGSSSAGRPARTDPARRAAFDVLRAVAESDAYANLVLPGLLDERGITGRDAAFATELAYGTLRLRGRYDAVIQHCSDRRLREIDPRVLDALRLGAHQLLGMRVPPHAAVGETVSLVREVAGAGPASFANAVLRAVGRTDAQEWTQRLGQDAGDAVERLALLHAHPTWIVRSFREALALDPGTPPGELDAELTALLEEDNAAPGVTLAARPGLVTEGELDGANSGLRRGRYSPWARALASGSPERIAAVRQGRAGVQDEGSQLVALALAAAPITGRDERWADLCAGPGGKAALLGAVLHERAGAAGHLLAGEIQAHRVGLVRRSVKALPDGLVTVAELDGRLADEEHAEEFDRVLVDVPCTGLGALRRRPEARWRRTPDDLAALAPLQRELLAAALGAVRHGGVVAYVTCSPHLAETRAVVESVARRAGDVEFLDAAAAVRSVSVEPPAGLGEGPYAQLWPHRHGTDAMFLALLRRLP